MHIEDRGARYSHGRRETSDIREGAAGRECYGAVALDSARMVIEGTNAGAGLIHLHHCRARHCDRRSNARVIREGAASPQYGAIGLDFARMVTAATTYSVAPCDISRARGSR
jgi:hypothetical protein